MIAEQQSSIQSAFNGMVQKIGTVENLSSMLSTNELVERYAHTCLSHTGHNTIDLLEVRELLSTAKINSLIHDMDFSLRAQHAQLLLQKEQMISEEHQKLFASVLQTIVLQL